VNIYFYFYLQEFISKSLVDVLVTLSLAFGGIARDCFGSLRRVLRHFLCF
jgi:hypothetical protein